MEHCHCEHVAVTAGLCRMSRVAQVTILEMILSDQLVVCSVFTPTFSMGLEP